VDRVSQYLQKWGQHPRRVHSAIQLHGPEHYLRVFEAGHSGVTQTALC
jgi:hypothetical protein